VRFTRLRRARLVSPNLGNYLSLRSLLDIVFSNPVFDQVIQVFGYFTWITALIGNLAGQTLFLALSILSLVFSTFLISLTFLGENVE